MKTAPDNFRKILERMTHSRQSHEVFRGFCRLVACTLACQTREPEYLEEAKRWQPKELEQFCAAFAALVTEMDGEPYDDLLGAFYMDFALCRKGAQWSGEFHTPRDICRMMARMTFGDIQWPADGKPLTICEPACGAGAMILAAAHEIPAEKRRHIRVTAIDINDTACDMCFINTTLWGVPCKVIHGNTLSGQFYKAWSNIHYLMPWLPLCFGIPHADELPGKLPEQGKPLTEPETKALNHALNYQQAEMQLV